MLRLYSTMHVGLEISVTRRNLSSGCNKNQGPGPITVVIWGGDDLLGSSIEGLLAAKQDWKVIRVPGCEDLKALLYVMETARPDIIIAHQEHLKKLSDIPLQVLRHHPNTRLVTVNLEDNLIGVYSNQIIPAREFSDLIAIIEDQKISGPVHPAHAEDPFTSRALKAGIKLPPTGE